MNFITVPLQRGAATHSAAALSSSIGSAWRRRHRAASLCAWPTAALRCVGVALRGHLKPLMKIATFNVNGITARLPRLLEWLAESQPDVACLQELKTSDETFPVGSAARGRLRRRLARPEGLQRRRHPGARRRPGRAPARPARRPGRHPQPLHRGGDARRGGRLDLPAQRQSAAGAEVRLQAGLVRAPRRARGEPDRERRSRSSWPATTTSSRPTRSATSTRRART